MSEYECSRCKRVYSGIEFSKSKFCPECGMFLRPKYIKETKSRFTKKRATEIETLKVTRDQVNVQTLFEEFMRLKDFYCGEGIVHDNVTAWIFDRENAYKEFQKKLSKEEIGDLKALYDNFKDFLYFKNNLSWTTLYRSGTKALNQLDRLRNLLTFLQNESILVEDRVSHGLRKYHVDGIGIGILTALLHTFYPDEYGVWNSRTADTLDIIKRKPSLTSNVGHNYLLINNELKQLSNEFNASLTTIDGFMWFISKRIEIID